MICRAVAVLAVLLCCVGAWAEQAEIPGEWKELTRSGITVFYQEETKDLAPQILDLAEKMLRGKPAVSQSPEIDRLAKNKDKVFQFVSSQLGLKEPSELVRGAMDSLLEAPKKLAALCPDPHRLRVWRKETLKKLLSEGKAIPGFTYDKASDVVTFQWNAYVGTKDKGGTPPPDTCAPIVIKDDPKKTPLDQAREIIDECTTQLREVMQMMAGGVVCHEAAEGLMAYDLGLRGPFRRWFCEGAANLIAERCLREFVGAKAARDFAEVQSTKEHESQKSQADLIAWRADEWEKEMPQKWVEEIQSARYAFSTHEVRELVKRHGPNTLPDIFKELRKVKWTDENEGIPDQAIYDAIKKVTGEDMKAVLAGYSKEIKDEFRGIVVGDVEVGECGKDKEGGWQVINPSGTSPVTVSGTKGICVQFHYAVMNPPAALKIELKSPSGEEKTFITTTHTDKLTSANVDALGTQFGSPTERFAPGYHRMFIYINDRLLKMIDIKVTGK